MAAGHSPLISAQMYMHIHLFENLPEIGEKSPIDLRKCTLMFFQSRCNTFVTFVYFYIRLFGKKLEKSCLTERLNCEQKCAKKGLCAICIVEILGITAEYREIPGDFRGDMRQISGGMPPEAAEYC